MTNFYHPAAYSQLLTLRQDLTEAFERMDWSLVPALADQIDKIQLVRWMEGIVLNAS